MFKDFKSLDEQIQTLLGRNLVISNIASAKNHLLTKNYFELINGFESLFIDQTNTSKTFLSGVTFDNFLNLYSFDKKLSSIIFNRIDRFENKLKASVSYRFSEYIFSKNPNAPHDFYIDPNNYDNPYSLGNLLTFHQLHSPITQNSINKINSLVRRINDDIHQLNSKWQGYFINPNSATYHRKTFYANQNNFSDFQLLYQTITTIAHNFISELHNINNNITNTNQTINNTTINTLVNNINFNIQFNVQLSRNTTTTQNNESSLLLNNLKLIIHRIKLITCSITANLNTTIYNIEHFHQEYFLRHDIFQLTKDNLFYYESKKNKYKYLSRYTIPPFWVLIKTFELGKIHRLMYGLPTVVLQKISEDMGHTRNQYPLLINSLQIINELRNWIAHCGLINRFRTSNKLKIDRQLIANLILTPKNNTQYEIRLYDTLMVLNQYVDINELNYLFEKYFLQNHLKINFISYERLLSRMGNEDLNKWLKF